MPRAAPSAALLLLLSCLAARASTAASSETPSASLDTVSTLAGSGARGWEDGAGAEARFSGPYGVAVGPNGTLVVADAMNHVIRTVSPSGVVSSLAGGGPYKYGAADGAGTAARFSFPTGVAVGGDGVVYAADSHNNRVVKITPDGVVTTLAGGGDAGAADGVGTAAQFSLPKFVAVDAAHNVYVTDMRNHRVRKIAAATGVVTTFAGSTLGFADGTGTAAQFSLPQGIAVDGAGFVYVGDYNNNMIRKISPEGVVSTLAGGKDGWLDATGAAAKFDHPADVAVDAAGNVYVAGNGNRRVRKITPAGVVSTLAGSGAAGAADGAGDGAAFSGLWGIAVEPAGGAVYIADASNNKIRKIDVGGVGGVGAAGARRMR
jgi:sugar lactone lactonase YvrE